MSTQASEAILWREVAWRVFAERHSYSQFLCRVIDSDMNMKADVERRMLARIRWHMKGVHGPAYNFTSDFCDPTLYVEIETHLEGNDARVLAALWMALEAEDELKAAKRARRRARHQTREG